jgi:hypothetical protein
MGTPVDQKRCKDAEIELLEPGEPGFLLITQLQLLDCLDEERRVLLGRGRGSLLVQGIHDVKLADVLSKLRAEI